MDVARLVLEYVKALAWPLVVAGAVFVFRRQIAAKIGDLKEVSSPVGNASFARDVHELKEMATDAAERQEAKVEAREDEAEAAEDQAADAEVDRGPTPAAPSEGQATDQVGDADIERRREQLRRIAKRQTFRALSEAYVEVHSLPDFDEPRETVAVSPSAAVMLAYSYLEKVARAAFVVERLRPVSVRGASVPVIVRELSQTGLSSAFVPLANELANVRNRLAHGRPGAAVTEAVAFDWIETCETIAKALASNARSKLRHPSRSVIMREWAEWMEHERSASDPDDPDFGD